MQGIREKWARDCLDRGCLVYKLSQKEDRCLFITKEKPNNDPHGRAPVYQVWEGDKRLYCGASYDSARVIFDKTNEG